MPTILKGEALPKEDKPLYKLSIEKGSNDCWADANPRGPFLLPPIPKENYINTSYPEEKVVIISRPAYDIDEEYRTASKSVIFLTFFTSCDCRLRKPLPIVIEGGVNPDIILIGNEELNKYGAGPSKEEALKDFEDFVIADYRALSESSPEDLTEDARELLALYASYIEL
ncbi:unnamed protein product [marine sediment metagenome]|uniref:Uncharacterized protein n=1 Tax=marine sediment metagenome TaxID=412755 RepID=X1LT62_9ZZZZ